jgi:hypothetical protein
MGFKTYVSKETVKARQVTDKGGETVVTTLGTVSASKGDYVVDTGDGIRVVERAVFESHYQAKVAPERKPAATKTTSAAARVKAAQAKVAPERKPAATKTTSAAARVKAAATQ